MGHDPELLSDLSEPELEALADGLLSPAAQARLDDLLSRNADPGLTLEEQTLLDQLLARVDQLTLLKTRARYTLQQHVAASRA